MAVLRDNKFSFKASECVWGQTELAYLGHITCQEGLEPDAKTVQPVIDWPCPTCLHEVLQILRLTNL